MTVPEITRRIRAAQADLADVAWILSELAHLAPTWLERIADHAPGPRSSLGSDGARGSGVSDPTGQAVANAQQLERGKPEHEARGIGWRDDPILAHAAHVGSELARHLAQLRILAKDVRDVTAPHVEERRVRYCLNPNCDSVIETPKGDVALTLWCPPCYRHRAEHGTDADRRTVMNRRYQQASRERRADASADSARS